MTITCAVEHIDKEKAHEYLSKVAGNRNVRRAHITDLIGRQRRGEWKVNGDTIRFDSNGFLRDGQHRLTMVTSTGIPIEVVVVRGIEPDAFYTMDTGRSRSLADVFVIERRTRPTELAGTVEWVWRYLSNTMVGQKGSHEQLSQVLAEHPAIETEALPFLASLAWTTNAGPSFKPQIRAAYYLFSLADSELAGQWASQLITGVGLTTGDAPTARLRNQLISYNRPHSTRPNGMQVFGICVYSFTDMKQGRAKKTGYKLPVSTRKASPPIPGFPRDLMLAKKQLQFADGTDQEDLDQDNS